MEKKNKSELLFLQLCQRIANLPDGTPFPTVRELMAEYQLSQGSVAPAINMLKERGLLESVPRQGMFVRKNSGGRPKILLLQPNWESENLVNMRNMFRRAAARHGFEFELDLFDYRDDVCNHLNDYAADCIIADSITNDQLQPGQILKLTQSAAPVILCSNAVPVGQIRYVCGDNAASGALAARYLIEKGHSKIGLLYCEPRQHTPETVSRNFRFVAGAGNCEVTMLDCEMRSGDTPDERIREFARNYAAGKYDFSALFAVSDHGALIAIREFEAQGITVPDQLSILGFGNILESGMERLTTIDTPRDRIIGTVMTMAADLIHGRSSTETQVEVMPRMIERSSVQIPLISRKAAL